MTRALFKIGKELPAWDSVVEKVLALRQNNYNVDLTIAWKLTEMEFDQEDLSTYVYHLGQRVRRRTSSKYCWRGALLPQTK